MVIVERPGGLTILTAISYTILKVKFTIWYDVKHQNGAVIRERLFKISCIEIYWGFVHVIQIWLYLK